MQTIHTKAGFKVLRESLGLYQSDVAEAADVDPYPLPYFREQDLAAEDVRAARIS